MGSSQSNERRADRRASRNQRNDTAAAPPPGASANVRQPAPGAPPSRAQQNQRGPSVIRQQPPPQQQQQQTAPPMPQHLMQHQHPSYQQRAPPSAMPPRGPAPSNMGAARVTAEVKHAKNVEGLCTIHTKKVQVIGDCISFVVTTTTKLCDYEIHVAVRETIRKGEVIFTPNKAKQPPTRITIEGEHDDLELVVPLELEGVSEQEKQYIKEYPKQIPLVIALRYVLPNGQSMCEFTYVQLLPKAQSFRQLIQTPDGVFKCESMFGGDDEMAAAVVADDAGRAGSTSPGATGGAAGGGEIIETDDGDECVICLTDPKDTVVVPCRHLCICKGCAERLRTESVKQLCPVCRGPIDQMLHIDRHK